MIRVTNIKLTPAAAADKKQERELLKNRASRILRVSAEQIKRLDIARKSLDARDKKNIFWLYSVDADVAEKKGYLGNNAKHVVKTVYEIPKPATKPEYRPVIIGGGPAGLFAAYVLAEAGLCPIIIERGKAINERKNDISALMDSGILNTESNIHFGEGGAGAFSDGKLTAINSLTDKYGAFVFDTLAAHHAPSDILYLAKPHIGTDQLENVLRGMREKIETLGGEFRFSAKFVGFSIDKAGICGVNIENPGETVINTRRVILAIGGSARDTFEILHNQAVVMKPKPMAIGLRVEHNRQYINEILHGGFDAVLPPATYHMAYKAGEGRGVYTFCACPGGFVVPSATEAGGVATNGMSYYRRDGANTNAAVLVNVDIEDYVAGEESPLAGVDFCGRFEQAAYSDGFLAPIQKIEDFLGARANDLNKVKPTYKPGVIEADLRALLGERFYNPIAQGLRHFDKILPGYAKNAVLTGIETRSSSPITIPRDWRMFAYGEDKSLTGLIPAGDGAGHSGGIISAAIDGIRAAESIIVNC